MHLDLAGGSRDDMVIFSGSFFTWFLILLVGLFAGSGAVAIMFDEKVEMLSANNTEMKCMVTETSSEMLSFREIHYAVKAHRRMNLESHFLYFGGVSLILLGIVFELVMLVDSRRLGGQVIGVSLIVCIMALFGMMLIKASRDHKYVLHLNSSNKRSTCGIQAS